MKNGNWWVPADYVPRKHYSVEGTILCGIDKNHPNPSMRFRKTPDLNAVNCKACLSAILRGKYRVIAYIVAVITYLNGVNNDRETDTGE